MVVKIPKKKKKPKNIVLFRERGFLRARKHAHITNTHRPTSLVRTFQRVCNSVRISIFFLISSSFYVLQSLRVQFGRLQQYCQLVVSTQKSFSVYTILCSITVPRRSSHICTQQHLPHGTIIIIIIILVKPINERAVCKRYIIICAHCRRVRRYLRRRRTLKSCSYRAALVVRFLTKDVQFVRARKELQQQCTTAFNITYILQFISHAAASLD